MFVAGNDDGLVNRPGAGTVLLYGWMKLAQERAVTALENIAIDTAINRRQRQGYTAANQELSSPGSALPMAGKASGYIGWGRCSGRRALALLPNPRQLEADRQQAVRREAVKQSHQVAAVRKKMEQANKTYPLAEREKTIKTMRELEKQLARTGPSTRA